MNFNNKRLVELFDKYKCDKGNIKHRYDRVYEPVLEKLRKKPFRMLEVGIFKGNSTKAFVEFCPDIEIIGVDIFTRVNEKDIEIFQDARVTACKCNSLEGANDDFKKLIGRKKFDIIIDDGLHTHEAQWRTFLNFIPYLKESGVYFIEDVWAFDKMTAQEKEHYWLKKHGDAFSEKEYQKLLDAIEPYDVTYHDLRKGYDPDTFILEIRK